MSYERKQGYQITDDYWACKWGCEDEDGIWQDVIYPSYDEYLLIEAIECIK